MTTTTHSPMFLHLARCATDRAHLAAHEGDRARYWRELAAVDRLVGFADPSVLARFDALGGMTDHCILDLKAQAFRCRACHGWQLLSLPPLPLAELVRRADEFNTRHHHCKNHDQDSH